MALFPVLAAKLRVGSVFIGPLLLAVRNEEANLLKCLDLLAPAEHIILIDSQSVDATGQIAASYGVDIAQFRYGGGYPNKNNGS